MTVEDQIAVMFARANPVPNLDLLDPVEEEVIDRLGSESERSSMLRGIDTSVPETDAQPGRRPVFGLVAAGIMTVALAGGIIALANRGNEVVALPAQAPPVEVAEAYMAAMNAHDAETVMSMLAENVVFGDSVSRVELYPSEIEQEGVLGWTYQVDACVESTSTQVACTYAFSNDITRALGTGPYSGNSFTFTVENGEVTSVTNHEDSTLFNEDIGVFLAWMAENHPEVELRTFQGMTYQYYDEETLDHWRQFLPEFVTDMSE